ncbi:MAG: hypothetical protein Q9209_003987 [Squamulea sp. 1 TL-2023]
MPRLFGRKYVCFYCNRRSAQDRKADVRQWQCEQCDAVNHLDEHGEITDPPIPSTQTTVPARYAQPQPPSFSREANLPDRSLFCPRCVQNQHIVNQALAEYLPSQDDPTYSEFEQALPNYRKKMEERFPQVCDDCAPAVDDRIRLTGYAAKTDHLRRMMDRTRGKGDNRKSWTWKNLGVLLGGIGWSVSLLGHLALHIFRGLSTTEGEHGLSDPDNTKSVLTCFVRGLFTLRHPPSCSPYLNTFVGYSFGLGLLCCWWNPRMHFKLQGGYGRVVGRADYYKLQLVALAIRFVTWKLAATDPTFAMEPRTTKAIHALGLVLELLNFVLSLRAIRIDQRPQVSFQEHYEPLVPTQLRPRNTLAFQHNSGDFNPSSSSRAKPFPIEKLVATPSMPQRQPYQPPTPPPENDDGDMGMDWTPQHVFRPARTYNTLQAQPAFNEPSPFHGTLPPAPVSWAQQLRNPARPSFHKASEEKKENFFGRTTKRILPDDASEVSSQCTPEGPSFMSGISSPVKFAPPRFFAPADRTETGLESLFEDTFTLSKDTKLTGDQTVLYVPEPKRVSLTTNPSTRLVIAILLSMACVAWEAAGALLPNSVPAIRIGCQLVAATISCLNAASSAALPQTTRSMASAVFYGMEATAAAALTGQVWQPWGYDGQFDFGALGLWFLIGLSVQEVWDLISSLLVPASSTLTRTSAELQSTHQDTMPQKPAVQQQALQKEPRPHPFNQAPIAKQAPAFSTSAKVPGFQSSQRTTRSRTRGEGRRDSLGVNGLGSLSLGR